MKAAGNKPREIQSAGFSTPGMWYQDLKSKYDCILETRFATN